MGRQMDRCLLVDNSPVSLALCPDNGVVVSSWTEPPSSSCESDERISCDLYARTAEDPEDNELMELLLMLQQCEEEASAKCEQRRALALRGLLLQSLRGLRSQVPRPAVWLASHGQGPYLQLRFRDVACYMS